MRTSFESLESYVGKTIAKICHSGFGSRGDEHNHCAHFVGHALGINVGLNCVQMGTSNASDPACIRVHELFAACRNPQELAESGTELEGILFISDKSNFRKRNDGTVELQNVPKKHVGYLLFGFVWHYSNIRDVVVRQTVQEMAHHYSGQTSALWRADMPLTSSPRSWAPATPVR